MPSTSTQSKSDSSDNKLNERSKALKSAYRRNRLNTLIRLPKCTGTSSHDGPVRVRQSTASRNCRLSAVVTPGAVALPVSIGWTRAHMEPVSTVMPEFIRHPVRHVCAADLTIAKAKPVSIRKNRSPVVNRPWQLTCCDCEIGVPERL